MLTTQQPHAPSEPAHAVIHCHVLAYSTEDTGAFPLGTYQARSPRLALRWLHPRAQNIADQVDAPAAQPARSWIDDQAEHERALSRFAHGATYTFTIADDTTRYVLSARPAGARR